MEAEGEETGECWYWSRMEEGMSLAPDLSIPCRIMLRCADSMGQPGCIKPTLWPGRWLGGRAWLGGVVRMPLLLTPLSQSSCEAPGVSPKVLPGSSGLASGPGLRLGLGLGTEGGPPAAEPVGEAAKGEASVSTSGSTEGV